MENTTVSKLLGKEKELISKPSVLFVSSGSIIDHVARQRSELLSAFLKNEGWTTKQYHGFIKKNNNRLPKSDFGNFARRLSSLMEIFRQLPRFDLVFLFANRVSALMFFILPMLLVCKFYNKKIILSYEPSELEDQLDRWFWLWAPFFKLTDKFVVSSIRYNALYEKYDIAAEFPRVLFEHSKIKYHPVKTLQPKILSLQPLTDESNIYCLLRAFSFVKQKYPRAELMIAGDGPEGQSLLHWLEKKKIYGVEFIGDVHSENYDELFEDIDLLVNSSSIDTFPSSIYCSFLAGRPVVTTDAGSISEVIENKVNGMIVPVNNHVRMAESIIELIENPDLLSKVVERAYFDVKKHSWQNVSTSWKTVLKEVANS